MQKKETAQELSVIWDGEGESPSISAAQTRSVKYKPTPTLLLPSQPLVLESRCLFESQHSDVSLGRLFSTGLPVLICKTEVVLPMLGVSEDFSRALHIARILLRNHLCSEALSGHPMLKFICCLTFSQARSAHLRRPTFTALITCSQTLQCKFHQGRVHL